jgi:hypothetical protein
MTKAATNDKANPKSARVPQAYAPKAYAPSWVDRFTMWVDRLPGASWFYYVGLGLVLFLLPTAILWGEGALPINSSVHYAHGFMAGAIAFFLVLFHYLDERAGAALAALRPALKIAEQEYGELQYQLTTLPARSTLLASLVALAFNALAETLTKHYHLPELNSFPISGHVLRFLWWLLWWLFGAFIYHAVHQLRLINRIYTQHTRINLFRMQPLYALSSLAALTAGSLNVVPYGFLFVSTMGTEETITEILKEPAIFSLYIFLTLLAFATFIWPQLGIHRLQVEEKERLLDEANQRFHTIILELHRRVDEGKFEGMDDVNKAIDGLEIERNALGRIPTWPWEPEVVRLLITALALPLGLWIAQYVLQSVLGS